MSYRTYHGSCHCGQIQFAFPEFGKVIDHDKLKKTITIAMRMLDNVIDINFYPTDEAKNANQRHRPVGLGLMGFQDALYLQHIAYGSDAAVEFADHVVDRFADAGGGAAGRGGGVHLGLRFGGALSDFDAAGFDGVVNATAAGFHDEAIGTSSSSRPKEAHGS